MSSSDGESSAIVEINQQSKRKKGICNRSMYKSEKIKKAKVKGEAHINHVGKEVMARKTGVYCK